MAEYIEREAVKKVFKDFGKPLVMAPGFAARQIDAIHAADVAPVVHGRWEVHPKDTHASLKHLEKLRCTHCWHFFYHDCGDSKNYCPNCGADMRGE